jgi:hypothetical protein
MSFNLSLNIPLTPILCDEKFEEDGVSCLGQILKKYSRVTEGDRMENLRVMGGLGTLRLMQ